MVPSFGKQDILLALFQASSLHPDLHIPYSYRSLIRWEKKGIIPLCKSPLQFGSGRLWRVYSRAEIDSIVKKVVQYKMKHKNTRG